MSHDVSRLKWVTDESVIIHHANDHTNHRSFLKFCGNVEIPWQRANSAARLEIPQPAENCGPYWYIRKASQDEPDLSLQEWTCTCDHREECSGRPWWIHWWLVQSWCCIGEKGRVDCSAASSPARSAQCGPSTSVVQLKSTNTHSFRGETTVEHYFFASI